MRLLFFGTPEFALPTLERLLALEAHEVVGVVSQPDRPRGRGRAVHPSPVSALALARELPLWRPERVGTREIAAELGALAPDLGVVVAFGQFLPRRIREGTRHGYLINGHASLLPKYRGAAPIARAILDGERETGISVMRVEREMDAGAVALVRRIEIGPNENAGELGERLSLLCADAIEAALATIADGSAQWVEQDHAAASEAPKLGSADQDIRWDATADAIARQVRALAPTPGARSWLGDDAVRILAARAERGEAPGPPGSVSHGPAGELRIATGDGRLVPLRLQRAGGKALEAADFLRGRPIPDGAHFGPRS